MSGPLKHDWRPGREQHCGNLRCDWRRILLADLEPGKVGGYRYRHGEDREWQKHERVPRCGSEG